ncbi:MAG: MOSC domain-containing protein [Mycobacteriales bacterium]
MTADLFGTVASVNASGKHTMSKPIRPSIRLVAGLGVEGDAHAGATVKHRSRVRQDPTQPNLRQVHLVACELLDELHGYGFDIGAGVIGENITTLGVDLLALPRGARLRLGSQALIEVTGLRTPCVQLDGIRPGLMKTLMGRDANGDVVRRAGIMAVVVTSGEVFPGNAIEVWLPAQPHQPLQPV